jgi:Zn-dependent M28 family amino/carboxypeptidase
LEIESRLKTKLAGCRNVLAYIEGSDPVLKDEVVVIGAHLDHLGKQDDYIYNGADDNGSGSAALLEIARAFNANPVKPKRTVLFILWTGEEWNYQGSGHYVKHPSFPLKKTVVYINIDMISREWTWKHYRETLQGFHGKELPAKKPENLNLANFLPIEVLQPSTFMDTLRKNNRYVGLHAHFIPVPGVIFGSDHLPFANHQIPWLNPYGGETDDYHTPLDSVEKVNLNLIEKGARLIWLTAFALADSSK